MTDLLRYPEKSFFSDTHEYNTNIKHTWGNGSFHPVIPASAVSHVRYKWEGLWGSDC